MSQLIDPCGQVMDMLRSYHLTRTRMTSDTGEEFWVRWYPCAPGALHYPDWHAFGSPVWEEDLEDNFEGPGCFHQPLCWRGSTYPAPPGQEHHGPAEWFEFGVPSHLLQPAIIADLCGRTAIDPRGGIGLSGDAVMMGVTVPTDFQLDKIDTPLSAGSLNNVDLGSGGVFRLNPNGPALITGFLAGANGRMIILENIGNDPIFLLHLNGASDDPNRIICIDEFSCRLTPRFATWLQYDGASEKWREMSSVPIVRDKGDLITHTLTTATRLPVSPTPGDVLTADPGEDVGMKWATPQSGGQGGGDLNYWRQAGSSRFGLEHWYTTTYGSISNAGPSPPGQNKLLAVPFISPRAGTLEKIGLWVASAGSSSGLYLMGIYDSVSEDDLYPNNLLAVSEEHDGSEAGAITSTIDLEIDGRKLYWLVYAGNNQTGSGLTMNSWTTPPHWEWPLFGHILDTTFGAEPQPILIVAAHVYDSTLPDPFPGGGTLQEFENTPRIGVTYAD